MDLDSKFLELKRFLSVSDDNKELERVLGKYNFSDYVISEILVVALKFSNYFLMFKEIKPFMNSVHACIIRTLESFNIETIQEFEDLFVKNALLQFMQEYIDYANISQKDQVLNMLAGSLEKLETQPLIINLGLMLKPLYQDQDYLLKKQSLDEIEVEYVLNAKDELEIKQRVNMWLNVQDINLDEQNDLKIKLIDKFNIIVSDFHVTKETRKYEDLFKEIMEMFAMKLTLLSLMELNDSLEPLPLK